MNNLLDLYPTILAPILSDWIYDLNLCCLDSAVCNSAIRVSFLKALEKCIISNVHCNFSNIIRILWRQKSYYYYYEWIAARGMGIRRFWLSGRLSCVQTKILSRLKYLEYLEAPFDDDMLKILDLCPEVHRLVINPSRHFTDDDLMDLVAKLVNLQSIDFKGNHTLTARSWDCLHETFPALRALSSTAVNDAVILGKYAELRVVDVPFSTDNASAVGSLTHLESIKLVSNVNGFKDEPHLLKCVESSPSLMKFHVNFEVHPSVVNRVLQCQHLTSLEMTELTDRHLVAISAQCPLLEHFKVETNDIIRAGLLAFVRKCLRLTSLWLSYFEDMCDLTVLSILSESKRLTSLSVQCGGMTDFAGLSAFTLCPTLTELSLSSTEITTRIIVSNAVDLQLLKIIGVDPSTTKATMSRNMLDPNDRRIIQLETSIFDSFDIALFHQCPRLLDIYLEEQPDFKDDSLKCLVECCPLLTSLTLIGCDDISNQAYSYLAAGCPNLIKLVIRQDNDINDDIVRQLVTSRPRLEKLWLNYAKHTDAALQALADCCPSLRSLDVCCCDKITAEGLKIVLQKCLSLSYLDMRSCDLDAVAVLKSIEEMRRRMLFIGAGSDPEGYWCAKYLAAMDSELIINISSD